ncbi:hypothetical protein GCM10010918_03760 [Paenibacillus radicis (ex Gao et al. 2016)]|uniref:Uncharacterized protein n=1 Tax=Paenibacillus radicis (ex Gao et al. 2016) TaxID=1737354 RepID=A0A917LRY9_9BACL|nr:hypothetical protein GCM10010918_03760 [Paenibacillus radicis (ex Gao et al. 2016)]
MVKKAPKWRNGVISNVLLQVDGDFGTFGAHQHVFLHFDDDVDQKILVAIVMLARFHKAVNRICTGKRESFPTIL